MPDDNINKKLDKVLRYLKKAFKKKIDVKDGENLSLNGKVDEILRVFEGSNVKIKKFRLPMKIRMSMKRYYKKNRIIILKAGYNNTLFPVSQVMSNGMIKLKGQLHTVPVDRIMMWKGKFPCIFLPEWQITPEKIEPISTSEVSNKAEKDHNLVEAQTYLIRAFKKEALGLVGKKLGGKAIIWIVIAAAVIGYILFGG